MQQRRFDRGGPYEAPKSRTGSLSSIEKLLRASDSAPSVGMNSTFARPMLKTLASMLGTYNPDSGRIEVGMRPGIIDDVIGIPSAIDDISALLGHGTNLAGDTSKTAAALSDASLQRRAAISPSRGDADSVIQGVSDVLTSVPGSQPSKLGKLGRAATALPRAIYDTVVPAMDLSTKTGKAVAGGSAALGGGLGLLGDGPQDESDFFAGLSDKLDGSATESQHIDQLIAKAQSGDRAAYEQLKILFPSELK